MTDVLIRDVPEDELQLIRAAAAEQGASLQAYLRDSLHDRVVYLRRQAALAKTARRLEGREPVPEEDRTAVLDAMHDQLEERADRLGGSGR